MKTLKITLIALTMIGASSIYAQNGVLKTNARPQVKTVTEDNYKAHADGWMIDMEKAYDESKKTGKPIMANFTGSDWCGWCKKLKYEVFDKDEFKSWAEKNVVLVELDFPRRFQIPQKYQEQNQKLARGFAVSGYPTIWVFNLDKDDKGQMSITKLGKTGYVKGVPAFTSGVDNMIAQSKK
jgi:thioredoxin-related protein